MFLSTGRCGTQWLAAALRELHPEIEVAHEPIGPLYAPRRHFRRYRDPEAMLTVPAVAAHVAAIEHRRRPYVETGWPLFPVLPLLARRIPERLRVVHLTRHPVPSALSHLAHGSYAGSPRDDAYTRLATLGPDDPGVQAREYRRRWAQLSAYEKCLFWWTEVHAYGLELPARLAGVPFLRVRSEALLAGERATLERLLAFIGLGWQERWRELVGRVVDQWHHHTDQPLDPLLIRRHPRTISVADRLGYAAEEVDLRALVRRYAGRPDPGLDRIGRFESDEPGRG